MTTIVGKQEIGDLCYECKANLESYEFPVYLCIACSDEFDADMAVFENGSKVHLLVEEAGYE